MHAEPSNIEGGELHNALYPIGGMWRETFLPYFETLNSLIKCAGWHRGWRKHVIFSEDSSKTGRHDGEHYIAFRNEFYTNFRKLKSPVEVLHWEDPTGRRNDNGIKPMVLRN